MMEHVTKKGGYKILKKCQLPLTRDRVVDQLITDLTVFKWVEGKMTLTDVASITSVEHIRSVTEASFDIADHLDSF